MFTPPRCPNPSCPASRIERDGKRPFFIRRGYYHPKCRAHPVPRFKCRECGIGFSRQTFREDYRDHKPHLNAKLLELLSHGLGLRQSAIIVQLSRRCAEMKARKMSRHLAYLNRNMLDQLPEGCSFQLDEMESFEKERTVCPVTLPVLIEQESMFIVAARSASIRPSGKMSPRRLAAIRRRQKLEGRRGNGSKRCVKRVLWQGATFSKKLTRRRIDSDEKSTYPGLIRETFGPGCVHLTFSSKLPRDSKNALFPINHMNAMARYLTGRLRRRSWLCSKERKFLDLQLNVLQAYLNYVRPRFNGEKETPAMVLGLTRTRFRFTDLLSWRQDWGWYSLHPLDGTRTIRRVRELDRKAGRASFQVPVVRRGQAG